MPAFELYKPDTAVKSRWILGVCGTLLFVYGCHSLFYALPEKLRDHAFGTFRPLGEEFPISWALILSVGLAIAACYGVWRAVNYAKLVDFFADTETEMTKVSWSSRREVIGSSLVVIVTVVILGVWIAFVDFFLYHGGRLLGATLGRLFR